MKTLYEVNITVHRTVTEDFAKVVKDHMVRMLQLPGFLESHWYEEETQSDKVHWTVQYLLKDRESLENYLTHHAPTIRKDSLPFEEKVSFVRRILRRIE